MLFVEKNIYYCSIGVIHWRSIVSTDFCKQNLNKKKQIIQVAKGEVKADFVLKNATYVNVFSNELLTGDIAIVDGKIAGLGTYNGEVEIDLESKIVCPGFIDAHIHLESSLVVPSEFAKAVIPHGTTTVITDPHEIANVMGTDGIEYMLETTENLPMDVFFMLPSCVPATDFDESGAKLYAEDIEPFFEKERVLGLAEMMNFPGVTHCDENVLAKLNMAQTKGAMIDGHAPGLTGKDLNAYVVSGVHTDHECAVLEEAIEKLRLGQVIQIREGTAARNLEALYPLLKMGYEDRCVFCTDDKHPNDLLEKGHMDYIVKRAIHDFKIDPIIAVKAASYYVAKQYGLSDRGAICPGYLADLVVLDNFENFNIECAIKNGIPVFKKGVVVDFPSGNVRESLEKRAENTFQVKKVSEKDFINTEALRCIGIMPGSIVTKDVGYAEQIDLAKDILKIAVVERHKGTGHIGLGFLQGYGLKEGAVATSIAHDSHNIIVVGTSEKDMAYAVNKIVENQGGIVVVGGTQTKEKVITGEVMLEIAGLMSRESLTAINEKLELAKEAAYAQGVAEGIDPFMSLSFMSLPVIPETKITTFGVVKI